MRDNCQPLTDLWAAGAVPMAADPSVALPAPAAQDVTWDRVEGMLVGVAVGDSLGNTSESATPAQRRAWVGEIRDYLPHRYAGGRRVGLPSDDTQMTFWTLERLIADGGLDPAQLLADFADGRRIFGIGSSVKAAITANQRGAPWRFAGAKSAGNGALMRIAPVILPHLRKPTHALWADAALATTITHRDHAAIASSVAFVALLWDLLAMKAPPPRGWFVQRFCEVARLIEGDEPRYEPRVPRLAGSTHTVWRFSRDSVATAFADGMSTLEACDSWYSGAFLLETVPSVLYILERHAADPEEAIIRAVNDTRDNDTVGAIVGAAVGALHGAGRLPARWTENLLGRTSEDDDGRVFDLLELAREKFGA